MMAFPLAWAMDTWNSARCLLQPIFVVIQCIPMFALAPIMVLWFDLSYTAILIPTALMIFFPLTMNIYQGLRSTPQHLLDFFKVNQATKWQIFFKLKLPWALPHICSGFRIAAAIAGIGAVAGEWAGAQAGLGMLMVESRRGIDLETTFGALFCLAMTSLGLYILTFSLEKVAKERRPLRMILKSYFKKPQAISVMLLILSLAGGCQQSESKAETRLLLDWLPNPDHVPLYVGMERGFFAEKGINLQILKIRDPVIPCPISHPDALVHWSGTIPSTIKAIAKGANLKPVGILIKEPLDSIIFRKGEIQTPKDLDGKTIGYCVDGSGTATLDALLEMQHIKPKDKINANLISWGH